MTSTAQGYLVSNYTVLAHAGKTRYMLTKSKLDTLLHSMTIARVRYPLTNFLVDSRHLK